MKRFLSIIIFFIFTQGCKSGIPKDIIQPNKMEKVLFDIHVVDGYIGTMINQDTTKIIASSYCSENCLLINSDTNFPEINAGGTPGPGTVNCPVKYKFLTFLLFNFGLKNAVCNSVLAIP